MVNTHVFPQDGDNNDAAHFGQLVGHEILSDYVITGCGLTPDYGVPDVDIAQGVVAIDMGMQTSATNQENILSTSAVVQVSSATLSLANNDVNHVYVEPDIGTNDNASFAAYTSTANAAADALKIGEVDTSNDTKTELNRATDLTELEITSSLQLLDDIPLHFGADNDVTFEYFSAPDVLDISGGTEIQFSNVPIDISGNKIVDGSSDAIQFDGAGETTFPSTINAAGTVNMENSSAIQDSGTNAINFNSLADVDILNGSLTVSGGDHYVTSGNGQVVGDTAKQNFDILPEQQLKGKNAAGYYGITEYSDDSQGGGLRVGKTRSGSVGTTGVAVSNGDRLFDMAVHGDDGTDLNTQSVRLLVNVDGSVGTDTVPGKFTFQTATSTGTLTDAVVIDSSQTVTLSNGKLDVSGGDIEDGNTTIWDSGGGHIEQSVLENNSLSLTGGNAIDAIGSVSLGGSGTIAVSTDGIQTEELDLSISPTWTSTHTFSSGIDSDGPIDMTSSSAIQDQGTIAINFDSLANVTLTNGKLDVSGGDIEDGNTTIWDTSAGEIPDGAMGSISNSTLANSSVTVTAGNGLTTGGTVALGSSVTLDIASGGVQTTELDLSISPTWTGTHTFDNEFVGQEIAKPTSPGAGYDKLYFKSDGNLYKQNSSGTEKQVGGTDETDAYFHGGLGA